MIKEKLNKNIFLSALLIIIIIVVIVFTIVLFYDSNKRDSLFDEYLGLQQQIVLDDIYQDYLDSDTNLSTQKKCEILHNQLSSRYDTIDLLLDKLRSINEYGIVDTDNKIKYTYILTNIKLWLQYKKLNNICYIGKDTILYFYPETKNLSLANKSKLDAKTKIFEYKLEKFKKENDSGAIALPYLTNIPIINQIINDYNISSSPAIVYKEKIYYNLDIKN
jgi:hypothetical protein